MGLAWNFLHHPYFTAVEDGVALIGQTWVSALTLGLERVDSRSGGSYEKAGVQFAGEGQRTRGGALGGGREPLSARQPRIQSGPGAPLLPDSEDAGSGTAVVQAGPVGQVPGVPRGSAEEGSLVSLRGLSHRVSVGDKGSM